MLKIKKRFPIGKLVTTCMSIVVIGACAVLGTMNARHVDNDVDVAALPHDYSQQTDAVFANEQKNNSNETSSSFDDRRAAAKPSTSTTASAKVDNISQINDSSLVTDKTVSSVPASLIATATSLASPSAIAASRSTLVTAANTTSAPTPINEKPQPPTERASPTPVVTEPSKTANTTEEAKSTNKPCGGLSLLILCVDLL